MQDIQNERINIRVLIFFFSFFKMFFPIEKFSPKRVMCCCFVFFLSTELNEPIFADSDVRARSALLCAIHA